VLDIEIQEESTPEVDQLASDVKTLIDTLEEKEKDVRRLKVATWRRNELMYRGIQRLFWDESDVSFKSPSSLTPEELESLEVNIETVDGIINIVKAHIDSIIGALSNAIPSTRFFPKNADDPADLMTARAFDKVREFIEKFNVAPMKLIEALHILSTEDFVAAHCHYKTSEEYGTFQVEHYKTVQVPQETSSCPNCGEPLSSPEIQVCPTCNDTVQPVPSQVMVETVVVDRVDTEHKGRVVIDIYGPRNVSVPLGCRDIKDTPYIFLEQEVHLGMIRSMYPQLDLKVSTADTYKHNTWARLPLEYEGQTNYYTPVKHCWIRPWAFEMLMEDEKVLALRQLYPKGLCAVVIDERVVEVYADNIDDSWIVSQNPLSRYVHSDPVANTIIPVQEMYTDLNDLTMDTIRHGIPETFADPTVVDFKVYKNHQQLPGTMIPAKAKPGMGLESSFYTSKTATLSKEVEFFMAELKTAAQFVSGAFPSVYGGPQAGGGTASEYEMSRNQALQRLSILWKMINVWWPRVMTKATLMFKNNLRVDESFVKKDGNGFINIWLRREEMLGEISEVDCDISEQFPESWAQQKAALDQIIVSNNPSLLQTVFHPNNMEFVFQTIGLKDLKIPGKLDRDKQLAEIAMMLKSPPNPDGSPTVPVDTELDDHDIHGQTIRDWLISDAGLDARVNNPPGYNNVYVHFRAHLVMKQMQMAQQAEAENTPESKTQVEIPEESNA
jgi:hypothetical protein